MKIGFIGGGNMAEAMIKGMTSQGMKDIFVSEPKTERGDYLREHYHVETTASNREVSHACGMIILAVKPQNMEIVLEEIRDTITEDKTVMSIAAGITLSYLSSKLATRKIIRVMPNTPALVQEGMSVMSLCECFSDQGLAAARDVLMSVGKVITLPEKQMDAVTALSGSGPAFFALFVEAMTEGGIHMGLSGDDAITLAVQTAVGTSKLLETGMPPAKLREMVTSPGGTTAAGLTVFDEKGFKDIIIDAMNAAKRRSEELGRTD
jgi:pyrroline-5-carboxylate reductase